MFSRSSRWWIAFSLAAALAPWAVDARRTAPVVAGASPIAREELRDISLSALHADPLAHLGRTVRFRVQVDAELAHWNPYLTRFGSEQFRAWRVWADEQFLWRASDWEAPLGHVFVPRAPDVENALARAPRFARFEVVAHVREVFLGRPWLEVASATRLDAEVDEASLVHASRATLLADNERWALALEELDRALAGNLPAHAREELWRLRGEYRELSGR